MSASLEVKETDKYRSPEPLQSPIVNNKWYLEKKVTIPASLFVVYHLMTKVIFPRVVSTVVESSLTMKFVILAVACVGSYIFLTETPIKASVPLTPPMLPKLSTEDTEFEIALNWYKIKRVPNSINIALNRFSELDGLGHLQSSYYLGLCYQKSDPPNFEAAFEAFTRSSAQKHTFSTETQWELALCHRDGKGTRVNILTAEKILQEIAEKKHPQLSPLAHYELGWFARVEGGRFNEKRIINFFSLATEAKEKRYFQKAAKGGYLPAHLELARIYKDRDKEEHLKHLKLAADGEDLPEACYLYAQTTEPINKRYLDKAIEQKYLKAAYFAYETTGNKFWLKKAADHGHGEAGYFVAINYEKGGDFKNMLEYLTMSADRGYSAAQRKLEGLYFRGEHVDRNIEKADELKQRREGIQRFFETYKPLYEFTLLENLALRGHKDYAYIVAHYYWLGIDIPQDKKKGIEWINKAVAFGHSPAKKWLAQCYWKGEGIERDLQKAQSLLN